MPPYSRRTSESTVATRMADFRDEVNRRFDELAKDIGDSLKSTETWRSWSATEHQRMSMETQAVRDRIPPIEGDLAAIKADIMQLQRQPEGVRGWLAILLSAAAVAVAGTCGLLSVAVSIWASIKH